MRYWKLTALCGIGLQVILNTASGQTDMGRIAAAQAYRARGEAVIPAPDGTFFCEAEEFTVQNASPTHSGWKAGYWGQNYFAATFANTFLSRKAFLGAPEQCPATRASIAVDIKEAGRYLVLARYEAPYRFESQFTLQVSQGGKPLINRLYGARANPKIWAFGMRVTNEVAWDWGAVENIVWEGHEASVDLKTGPATVTLIAGPQPEPAAKRNVDLILLTRDEAQVKMRIQKGDYLPLDGWLTQAGDVYLKVTNPGTNRVAVASLNLNGFGMQQHSPYWVHIRQWTPVNITVGPGQSSDWTEVGSTLDSLNDGQWGYYANGACQLDFGIRDASGKITRMRTLNATNGVLPLVSLADLRYSRTVMTPDEANQELLSYLKKLPVHGRTIKQTAFYCTGSLPREFYDFYGLNLCTENTRFGYTDLRNKNSAQLDTACQLMTPAVRSNMFVVSLGDEIMLPEPDAQAAAAGFVAYLKNQGVSATEADPASGGDWSRLTYSKDESLRNSRPALYYWSRRYLHYYGIQTQKKMTDTLRRHLPNAHIGANFSPHHGGGEYTQLGEVFKWVECFRQDGMTLPWAEDYIWQVPVGSPQMNGINLDLFRAGQRGKPGRKIMYYVMPHFPGNTPTMWRRLFHNAVGHGATILNLFEFNPVWAAYSENHVTGQAMYGTILKTLRELGLYEDIVQSGKVRTAQTALWFSETGDIWRDNTPPFGAAKRGLYIAILGQQLPLDFIIDQDAADGTLDSYKILFLTDNHVRRASSEKIAAWVKRGGTLFATAGAGMYDEYDRPNSILRALLGVEPVKLEKAEGAPISFIKQDLPFAKAMGEVTLVDSAKAFPVFGVLSKVKPAPGAEIQALFSDRSAAVVANKVNKGRTVYCAFLPSLSYFKPAIPLKPLDRGSTDDAMAHFIPTEFDPQVGALIGSAATHLERPVVSSAALVETSIIESKAGTILVVQNWSGNPIRDLKLTVNIPAPRHIELAGGGKVKTAINADKLEITFDLDVAETVIMR